MSTALATAMARLSGVQVDPAVALRLAAAGRAWDTTADARPVSEVPTQR